jgi:phosphoribosylglycinamide formyltransferase-1
MRRSAGESAERSIPRDTLPMLPGRPTSDSVMAMALRVGVLVSGSGTNLQAILDSADPAVYEVVLVVSNKPDAHALERARVAGVREAVVLQSEFADRVSFDTAVADMLDEAGVELVCLAGYMRILSPEFVKRFRDRILNIHPALLPAFPGASAVRDALDWGAKVTGTTVHLVDDEVDHGPIVLQEAVAIVDGDTESSLHERIKAVEHRLYPEAVRLFALGRVDVEGRRVSLAPGMTRPGAPG